MKKLIVLLFIIPIFCFGQVPDPIPNTYVNDLANVLTQEQIQSLNERILVIEKKSSVQIGVILLTELPANMEIDQYTLEVGRKWHVGNAHNGLVYVAAINQRKHRLEVADNLQGDIPDVTALNILDDIKPHFRNKDYYGGINALLDGIDKRVDPVAKEQMKLAAIEQEKKDEQFRDNMTAVFLWMLIIVSAFLFTRFVIFRKYFADKRAEKKRKIQEEEEKYRRTYENLAHSSPGVIGLGALGTAGMLAAIHTKERRKSYEYPQEPSPTNPSSNNNDDYSPPPSSYKSDDDNNSFGNFGSGSSDIGGSSGFSGGGASSDW